MTQTTTTTTSFLPNTGGAARSIFSGPPAQPPLLAVRLFQDIVKAAFMDKAFSRRVRLGAVNSINWARVLAQMTYYFYAYFQVCSHLRGWRGGHLG